MQFAPLSKYNNGPFPVPFKTDNAAQRFCQGLAVNCNSPDCHVLGNKQLSWITLFYFQQGIFFIKVKLAIVDVDKYCYINVQN